MFLKDYKKIKTLIFVSLIFSIFFILTSYPEVAFAGGDGGDVPPDPININIVASKIVCDSESDLPNWGAGGPNINADTASDFLASHQSCSLEEGRYFQWASSTVPNPDSMSNPEVTFIGEAGDWNTFGPTNEQGIAITAITVSSTTPHVWMREVLTENDSVLFSEPPVIQGEGRNDVSAEMYCHTDVLNYDNYDRVDSPFVADGTYYCIAFDVLKSIPPVNTPPTITLIGDNPLNLKVGDTFVEPGYTATDLEDGNLTASTTITGTVDTATTSTSVLVYSVTDSGGLSASTTRTVIVSDIIVPPIIPPVTPPSDGGGGGIGGRRHPVVVGEILGATSCLYLIDYLKIDWNNDPIEVLKLQSFLNVFEGESLSLTGIFNPATFEAVQRFQIKYSGDILNPWGENVTTGFVYILTKKKINEIYCNTVIPLSQAEQNEIDSFKSSGASASGGVGQLPKSPDQSQSQDQSISIEGSGEEITSIPIVNLSPDSDSGSDATSVSTSTSDSVVRNLAVSLFALPQKIFSNSRYFIIFLILLAIAITFYRLFAGSKSPTDVPVLTPISTEEEEEKEGKDEEKELPIDEKPPVIILPGADKKKDEKEESEILPDEEIMVENPEEEPKEEPEETIITPPDLNIPPAKQADDKAGDKPKIS